MLKQFELFTNNNKDLFYTKPNNIIELRREIGHSKTMDDMADLVGEAKGKVFFDKFRAQIKEFKERESRLLELRDKHLASTESSVVYATLLGTLIAVVIGVFVALWLTRHLMSLLGGEPSYIAKIAKKLPPRIYL